MEQKAPETKELKFSDFEQTSQSIKFDHDHESMWGAIGITQEDFVQLSKGFSMATSGEHLISKKIEIILNSDTPTLWKMAGLIKEGERQGMMKLMDLIMGAPDGVPMPIFKATLALMVAPKLGLMKGESDE